MAEFYQYTKARREFGRPCAFSDTKPISTIFLPFQPKKKDEGYVLRNPNFIDLDNLTDYSSHQVNTIRVSTGDKGMMHYEGGWPQSIDPTEQQQYNRFMKKIDKDQGFASQVKHLCTIAEKVMLKNNQIDMYEEYFQGQESQHLVENISTKTMMLLKDPQNGTCKRGVSEISWHVQNQNKLAASYSINRFQQTPDKMLSDAFLWDINYPNEPQLHLQSVSPVTNLSFNHKLTDLVGGGCANGIVSIWDSRKGKQAVATSHVEKSHHDPVTHFQWQMTKTGQQCVTVSTDGYAHFWDIRKLKEDRVQSLAIKDNTARGEEMIGVTALENSPETPTKYIMGTEQGTLVIANKRPKKPVEIGQRLGLDNRHLGPIYAISRNLQYPKVFMTMGDWCAKIWMDDLRTPLIKTKYHESYVSDGCFSPTRIGAFFLTRKDGWLDVWDYYYRQNEVAFSHKVSTAPLSCIKINYSGSGNQITGGKIAAIGDEDGTVTIMELCESLYTMQKNERDVMNEIFSREMIKQKNLQALRRLQELEKKRVPKDTTALQKKLEERQKEQIDKMEQKFQELLKEMGSPQSKGQKKEEEGEENK